MKLILFIGILILSFNSYSETTLFPIENDSNRNLQDSQNTFYKVRSNLKSFFKDTDEKLKSVFPEFKINTLIDKIDEAQIEFVNDEILTDENGTVRACLNFPDLSKIKCSFSGFENFSRTPKATYILILHQYLRLIDVKEITPDIDNKVDGYKISKKIFPYITYEGSSLWFVEKSSRAILSIPGYETRLHVEVWPYQRASNNILLEYFTSLYPTKKRLISKTLKVIDGSRCLGEGERVYYKDVHAFDVYHSRLSCENDRCPRVNGLVVLRYICGKERLISYDKALYYIENRFGK